MKKFFVFILACVICSCEKSKPILPTVTPTKTGRVELASVCAQSTFIIDDSGISGTRLGIYRSGRCEFIAYMEMEDMNVVFDSVTREVTIYCPPIQIAAQKYHPDEISTIYKHSDPFRDEITQKEKHHYENIELERLQDSLMNSKSFTDNLKNKGKSSAKILIPKLFSYNRDLKPNVVFKNE